MSTTTRTRWLALLNNHGSVAIFHRDDSMVPCPCRTPEGFRDPVWHMQNPGQPFCNAQGMLTQPGSTTNLSVKAFIQPIQSTRATRLSAEYLQEMFGEVQADDHIGIFPTMWDGVVISFEDWGRSTEDYVVYAGKRFTVVNSNLMPDPEDGATDHHWECGLRRIEDRPLG